MNKKLLVCDVERTIFKPKRISIEHASYVWAALASKLGREAEREEDNTHKKWRLGKYGPKEKGESYMNWVKDSISIHKDHEITEDLFNEVIDSAEYYPGTEEFFDRLDRDIYIPILISGGIQQLSEKACKRLRIRPTDSYVACSYFFNETGLDKELTFINTSNFFGKQEFVKLALRKYGLEERDWLFIGDGINDESVAKAASLKIGIRPASSLKGIVDKKYDDFTYLIKDKELLEKEPLLKGTREPDRVEKITQIDAQNVPEIAKERVAEQTDGFNIPNHKKDAIKKVRNIVGVQKADDLNSKFDGIIPLLECGEEILLSFSEVLSKKCVPSAVLQPFCNANEIMANLCYLLIASEKSIRKAFTGVNKFGLDFVKNNADKKDLLIELGKDNQDLSTVLNGYSYMRNICAHSYKLLSIEAAQTFARRTYENIQRMELMINPPGYSW